MPQPPWILDTCRSAMAQAPDEKVGTTADVARELMILVYKDRLVEAGHVDLPPCLSASHVNGGDKHNQLARVMVGMCRQVRSQYESKFADMIGQMSFTARTGYGQFLTFASELFQAGVTHGKIVSLYVFCAELANSCMNNPASLGAHYVASLMSWQLRCFKETVDSWLIKQGGWSSFEKVFAPKVVGLDTITPGHLPCADPEDRKPEVWRSRMAGMAVMTLGLAYVLGS
eukprot:scpid89099/ scgid24352/ Apoptosis regulator Bcl-2